MIKKFDHDTFEFISDMIQRIIRKKLAKLDRLIYKAEREGDMLKLEGYKNQWNCCISLHIEILKLFTSLSSLRW